MAEINYTDEIKKMEIPQIKEELAPYLVPKNQGEYTIEDYYALPDEYRVELIDGVIYDVSSPTTVHQILGDELRGKINEHIEKKKGKCLAITDLDTRLDCDDKTVVRPDVLVVCEREKFIKQGVFGAPDLVIEVLSPSSRKKDMSIKLNKYRNAGVREYWMVDPEKKRIYVYEFEKGEVSMVYTFEDMVPVGIFGGECEIDFAKISAKIRIFDF